MTFHVWWFGESVITPTHTRICTVLIRINTNLDLTSFCDPSLLYAVGIGALARLENHMDHLLARLIDCFATRSISLSLHSGGGLSRIKKFKTSN